MLQKQKRHFWSLHEYFPCTVVVKTIAHKHICHTITHIFLSVWLFPDPPIPDPWVRVCACGGEIKNCVYVCGWELWGRGVSLVDWGGISFVEGEGRLTISCQ